MFWKFLHQRECVLQFLMLPRWAVWHELPNMLFSHLAAWIGRSLSGPFAFPLFFTFQDGHPRFSFDVVSRAVVCLSCRWQF